MSNFERFFWSRVGALYFGVQIAVLVAAYLSGYRPVWP